VETTLHSLYLGFSVALQPANAWYAFLGCLVGTLVGVLPGIGPLAGISILLPVTFGLNATQAIIMLAGIYYGSQYGGSTTSILMRIPGEAASVMTCIDGYAMARKGRAGAALAIAAVGSFVAGTLSVVALMLLAPLELTYVIDDEVVQITTKEKASTWEVTRTYPVGDLAKNIGGELDYVAGVGPGTVSATLGGNPLRAVWIVADRLIYNVMAQPELKTLQDLRGKRIGVAGLGATTHTAFNMAVEKAGANPKDFIVVGLGPQQQQRALESKAIDAVMIDPPVLFVLQQKGFSKVLDIGALVEMPVGGLTTLSKTIGGKPDQVRRVIKALQEAKETLIGSKEKSVEFIVKTMKMDRDTAVKTFEIMAYAWAGNGVPTPVGMNNIVRGIQSQGRFAERKVAFEEIADPRLAQQVARELGHKE
jgi:ABC-type nitrate/sulfonate/bicarbonate transport system substrate-binding protein